MSRATEIADLMRKAGNAESLAEKREFVRQAEELKNEQHEASLTSGDWSAEDAVIRDTLVPMPVHERVTAATDWLMDLDDTFDQRLASQEMIAEASLWYGRVSDEVKSYGDEYAEQAKNLARRLSGKFGQQADVAEKAFLDEADRLRATAVRSGLIVEAGDAGETPPETKGPAQKAWERQAEKDLDTEKDGDTKKFEINVKRSSYEDTADDRNPDDDEDDTNPFQTTSSLRVEAGDDLYAVLVAEAAAEDMNGTTGDPGFYNDNPSLTNSNRAPQFQELQNDNSQDVVPVNDPGLGKTDDLTGANATRTGEEDHASKGTFPVHGKRESSMTQRYASCPTCAGHGKVAVRERELPSIDDISKIGVSGLDQIDQTVDPHDNGPKPTDYPADVAFPWVLNPQAQVPLAINQAEEQIGQRNSLSPLVQDRSKQGPTPPRQSVQSTRRQAGGRDNSGWMGDNGARGVDYPGEQVGQYPQPSTADGYVDPAHGQGGDVDANRPVKPYGAQEANDETNNPSQWSIGQPTQADQGWREVMESDQALQAASAYIEQRRQAFLRNGR